MDRQPGGRGEDRRFLDHRTQGRLQNHPLRRVGGRNLLLHHPCAQNCHRCTHHRGSHVNTPKPRASARGFELVEKSGRGIDPPGDFTQAKSVAARRKNTVIFLREIRKTELFGGRVAAPPLQCLCKQRFFDSLKPRASARGFLLSRRTVQIVASRDAMYALIRSPLEPLETARR